MAFLDNLPPEVSNKLKSLVLQNTETRGRADASTTVDVAKKAIDKFKTKFSTPTSKNNSIPEENKPVQGGGVSSNKSVDVSKLAKDEAKPELTDPSLRFGAWSSDFPTIKIFKTSWDKNFIEIVPTFIHSLYLLESIESICVMGELVIRDVFTFTEKLALNGNEIVEITLQGTQTKSPRILSFEIFQTFTRPRTGASGKMTDVVISLIQYPLWGKLVKKKIAKGYSNILVSEIIKDLALNFLNPKSVFISNTQGRLETFNIPYWDLATTLKYLERLALSETRNGNFFTWSTLEQTFNFRSLQDLYKLEPRQKFWVKEMDLSGSKDSLVISYEIDKVHKEFFKSGLAGGTTAGYDWDAGEFREISTTFSESSAKSLGSHYLYENIDSNNGTYQYGAWGNEIFLQANNDTIVSSAINSQFSAYILVNGILDISAGNKIEIQLSDKNQDKESLARSQELEGEWLIKAIHHKWNKDKQYQQKYILLRDSYYNINDPALKKK